MSKEDNETAFPRANTVYGTPGATKRELFASMMLSAIVSDNHTRNHNTPSRLAGVAVSYADALIAELKKKEPV